MISFLYIIGLHHTLLKCQANYIMILLSCIAWIPVSNRPNVSSDSNNSPLSSINVKTCFARLRLFNSENIFADDANDE